MAELADAIDSKSIVLRTSPFESGQGHHAVKKKLLYLARNKENGSLRSLVVRMDFLNTPVFCQLILTDDMIENWFHLLVTFYIF